MAVRLCSMEALRPFAGMVIVTLVQVGNMVIGKIAMNRGMNKYVIILYSNTLSTLILLPCSLILHRSERPSLTISTLGKIFLLALCGFSAQILGYAGVQYSSPTLNTAMINLVPAFTFMLAIIFRMEKLEWRSSSSQAKSLGTLVSITGAFIVTFYKGAIILKTPSHRIIPHHQLHLSSQSNWILGGLLLAAEAFMLSAFYIVQALILKTFQALFIIMFYLCLFGTILAAIFSLFAVEDSSDWSLRPDIGLVAISYSAIVATTFRATLCTWCLWRTGPLYVSLFTPLEIIVAVVMGVIFLGDALRIGSLIGATVVVIGFYVVLWGKAKEAETEEDSGVGSSESTSKKVPLLQSKVEEI